VDTGIGVTRGADLRRQRPSSVVSLRGVVPKLDMIVYTSEFSIRNVGSTPTISTIS